MWALRWTKPLLLRDLTGRDHYECFKRKGLHFLHLNARSLVNKISEIRLLAFKTRAPVISLSETWLDDSVLDNEISISDWFVVIEIETVAAFVCLSEVAFHFHTDTTLAQMTSKFFVVTYYCHRLDPFQWVLVTDHQNNMTLLINLKNCFSKLELTLKYTLWAILTYVFFFFFLFFFFFFVCVCVFQKCSNLFKKYLEVLKMFNLTQLITEAARVTSSISSLIDHILSNSCEKICQSGTISIGLSDPFLTYMTRKIVKGQISKHNFVKIRSMKHYNIEDFNQNWESVLTCFDVWDGFKNIFHSVLDIVAPLKEVRLKQRTEP